MAAAFSRMQLAAALIEYDNDPDDPEAPNRSAQESAIFAPMRRNGPSHYQLGPRARKSDYLGVSLPSEGGTMPPAQRDSVITKRKSKASTIAMNNPFGKDETVDGFEEEEENLEVDLASWGLDAFMPKEKGSKTSRNAPKAREIPNTQAGPSRVRTEPVDRNTVPHRRRTTRSMSVGNLDQFGGAGAFLDAESSYVPDPHRRRSFGSPLDLVGMEAPEFISHRNSPHPAIQQIPPGPPLHSIPFPSGSARSASPNLADDGKSTSAYRRLSNASTKMPEEALDNPFSVRPPSPARASRFDPKAERVRALSNATIGTQGLLGDELEEPQPEDRRRMRTMSNGTLDSRFLLGDEGLSVNVAEPDDNPRERPYSTMELMRPKVLVMPSPLQPIKPKAPEAPLVTARDGFQVTRDGPPLPPGARSTRRMSTSGSISLGPNLPVPSNSFTPNPRSTLSLAQLTFRNTLLVGGQRDVAYSDLDGALPRATAEGEQIGSSSPEQPVVELPPPETETDFVDVGPAKANRPAGKLYGKSLIDDLENRKAQMRSKQRVFTGDERPSMMARGQLQRASTLIDPATLQSRPVPQHLDSYGSANSRPGITRKNSSNVKPLLNFDNELSPGGPGLGTGPRMMNSRSVFGVDTLWEREMAKLKEIEAHEKLEAEEREKQEALAESKKRKGKGKRKGKSKQEDEHQPQPQPQPQSELAEAPTTRVSADPPTLPVIQKPILRRHKPADEDDSASDKSSPAEPPHARRNIDAAAEEWVGGSSDEEEAGLRRTTGSGPRLRSDARMQRVADDDSEEDIPLSVAVNRTMRRNTGLRPPSADSDDEGKPLSVLIENRKSALPSLNFDKRPSGADDDEDEVPLGLRASKMFPSGPSYSASIRSTAAGGEEDDTPLAFHPEQRRRTQYQMMAQQQQQQQQMMMQAQFQNSMFFGPPAPMMMAPPYFGAPMPMMPPPMVMPPPPPAHDAGKFGRVDRWRHDVAVEGEQ